MIRSYASYARRVPLRWGRRLTASSVASFRVRSSQTLNPKQLNPPSPAGRTKSLCSRLMRIIGLPIDSARLRRFSDSPATFNPDLTGVLGCFRDQVRIVSGTSKNVNNDHIVNKLRLFTAIQYSRCLGGLKCRRTAGLSWPGATQTNDLCEP